MPAAGEGQGYRVIVSQRVVGIKPRPTHPTPAFWCMCPSGLVPQEGEAQQGTIRGSALGSPLVESSGELYPTLHFGWYVKDDADRHVEVNSPKILIDTQ